MNSLYKLFLLLIFPVLLFTVSCSKEKSDEDKMPPFTETGANTFACKVNGKVWVAQQEGLSFSEKLMASYGLESKKMIVHGYKDTKSVNEDIGFDLEKVNTVGEYNIGGINGGAAYYSIPKPFPGNNYLTDSTTTGKVIIKKLDTINNTYSGTFYFDLKREVRETEEEVVHITEGQFDFKNK